MRDRLIKLLSQVVSDDFLNKNFLIEEAGLVPKDNVYMIYKRRLGTSNLISQEFVDKLYSYTGERVLLTNLKFNQEEYLIMTDESVRVLLGVIKLSHT